MVHTSMPSNLPSRFGLLLLTALLIISFTIIYEASAECRANNTSGLICSGRGVCENGECKCQMRYDPEETISGAFCECDNFSCDRHNGLLCSGPDHGICDCGKCLCLGEWTGSACECTININSCVKPDESGSSETVCSGRGQCECGVCKCTRGEWGPYLGKYCERCPTCPTRCQELLECVTCQAYKTGRLNEEECVNCTFIPIKVDMVEANEEKDEVMCRFSDGDDCRVSFVYSEDGAGNVNVRTLKERDCPLS